MHRIEISLTHRSTTTHVPLAAFGYALRRAGLLDPLYQVSLPIKTIFHEPGEKLIEALVLILAGGRATSQVDLLLRPNQLLARAWGQQQFAQQATLANTLDAFDQASIATLRAAFETLLALCSGSLNHDFRTGDLWMDGDLSGLPASRHSEGSTKGYFAGKKTALDANWPECASVRTVKRLLLCSIRAFSTRSTVYDRWSNLQKVCCSLKIISDAESSGDWMQALALTTRSNGCSLAIINSWSKATTHAAHKKWGERLSRANGRR